MKEKGEQLSTCLGLLIINRVDSELSLLRGHRMTALPQILSHTPGIF